MLVTFSSPSELAIDFDKLIKKMEAKRKLDRGNYAKKITKSSIFQDTMIKFIKKHGKNNKERK